VDGVVELQQEAEQVIGVRRQRGEAHAGHHRGRYEFALLTGPLIHAEPRHGVAEMREDMEIPREEGAARDDPSPGRPTSPK
jgi:hypothetical protein